MRTPAYLPSFVRRLGRKLKPNQKTLFETLLPQVMISNDNTPLTSAGLFQHPNSLWCEIGFGGGEHLAAQAMQHPHINFIGCEPYINGMAALLTAIEKHHLINIRVYDGDARDLLMRLPDASIDRIFILFPDPWPKNRHHKRRIIQKATLDILHTKLQPQGRLRIATDHVDYGIWILEQMALYPAFKWQVTGCKDWKNEPNDWVKTRYQMKALIEGRSPIFLDYVK